MKNSDMPAMPAKVMVDRGMGYMSQEVQTNGLTKREMFAMHAMQGLVSDADYADLYETNDEWVKNVVEASIEFADALLAELEKKNA